MLLSLLFVAGLSIPSIGADNSNNYLIMYAFNCQINIPSKYELYLTGGVGATLSAPPAEGGGSISYGQRVGNFEDRITNSKITKSITKNGLDFISFEVRIPGADVRELNEFVLIRDDKTRLLVSGPDMKDIVNAFESCAKE